MTAYQYQTAGIHHITAFVRNAQDNVDFYAGVLGLRLVKKTINFDAPEVYHLYFGDQQGSPGTSRSRSTMAKVISILSHCSR
jgi:glyoxalase family protein